MDTIFIYALCFEHDLSTSFYVGQTKYAEKRLKGHKKAIAEKKHNYAYLNNIENIEQVTMIIVAKCSKERALNIEHAIWRSLKEDMKCNIANKNPLLDWTTHAIIKGRRPSEETRKKISISNKIAQNRPEVRAKKSVSIKIALNHPEVKMKRKVANSGKNNPMYGKKLSVETKEKLSRALIGKKHSPETRAKISATTKLAMQKQEIKAKHKLMQKIGWETRRRNKLLKEQQSLEEKQNQE